MPAWVREINGLGKVTWVSNGKRVGQLWSADRLWSMVNTEYVWWNECDWEYTEHRYMDRCYEILRDNPDIFTVSVRSEWHHPGVPDVKGRRFLLAEPGWAGGFGSFMFNPGLRRKSDYERIGSYGAHGSYTQHSFDNELLLSKLYAKLGYNIAILGTGHCHHLGDGRSRAAESLVQVGASLPKLLIAVPVCHDKVYGRFESVDSPHYDPNNNFEGWGYGSGIHLSGRGGAGVAAVRATWGQDISVHKNIDLRFFYGSPRGDVKPAADEIFLDVKDDYEHLPQKTQAICNWAVNNEFEYVFKCDDDTAVYVDRLTSELCGKPFEYAGYVNTVNKCSGGPGYFLTKRAARIVGTSGNPSTWAEDMWVGEVLGRHNIYPMNLVGHIPGFSDHWYWKDGFDGSKLDDLTVAVHAVRPDDMRKWWMHKNVQKPQPAQKGTSEEVHPESPNRV